jgi:DNA-binding protein H-NS
MLIAKTFKRTNMKDLFYQLNNLRNLRVIARELDLEEIKQFHQKLSTVLAEKESEQEAIEKHRKEQENRLAEIARDIRMQGLNINDVLAALSVVNKNSETKTQRAKRPAKYKYSKGGIEKTWTGQGRIPRPMQEEIDSGRKTIEEFEI